MKIAREQLNAEQLEKFVTGKSIGMPIVNRVSFIHSQQASRITWHQHDFFELLYLLEGTTAYEFEDGEKRELAGGSFLVIPPGVVHRGLFEVRRPVQLCGIQIRPDHPEATTLTPFTQNDLERLREKLASPSRQTCRMNGEIRRLLLQLGRLIPEGALGKADPEKSLQLRLAICSLLMETGRQTTVRGANTISAAVQAAKAYLQAHLAESVSMDQVAAAARCSRARLFLVFKDVTGITPNHYLLQLRLKEAERQLEETDLSITAISLACGFSSSQYFSMVFRKYTGTTPLMFRQRQRDAAAARRRPKSSSTPRTSRRSKAQ